AVKGGRLAAACHGRCRTLAISDVVGDDLSVIGSGPTVPDASTFADALGVLERLAPLSAYPSPVVDHLREGKAGRREETPKPGQAQLAAAWAAVIGSRIEAMRGAKAEAERRGYRSVVIEEPVVGEAR